MTDASGRDPSELLALLAELVKIPAISGYEEPMMRYCRDRLRERADELLVDVRGNVCATFRGTSETAARVMLAAHMDTLGLIVASIDERGFIRFARGTLPLTMCSRRVWIHGEKGAILGVIGVRVGYGTSSQEQLTHAPDPRELYIDVGCSSREEVRALGIRVGDPITFEGELAPLGDGRCVVSPYLDDRAGIAVLLMLAARLKTIEPRPEVVLVATIEEELGLRGASTAAFAIKPDLGISIDTQPAGGTPEYDFHSLPILIGEGPVIKFSESAKTTNHPRVRRLLIEAAERAKVPYQLAAAPPGSTDIGAIEQAGTGIPAAAIGIPRRYAHSPNEVCDLRDILGTLNLLKEAIRILGGGWSLNRI